MVLFLLLRKVWQFLIGQAAIMATVNLSLNQVSEKGDVHS